MRGNIVDLFLVVIIAFVVLLTFSFGYLFYQELKSEDSFEFGTEVEAGLDRSFSVLDYGLILFVVISLIAVVVSAFFIQTHPVFFMVSLIIFMIFTAISFSITNVWMEIYSDPEISSSVNQFSNSLNLMAYAPHILIVGFVIVGIVLYASKGGSR